MIGYIEPDSLIPYVKNMYNLVEEYLDRNEGEMAIAQNSLYNYRFHEQKRIEAEKANNKLIVFLIVAVGFILVLIIVILIMRIRTNGRKMMLMQSYDLIADIRLKQRTLDMESGATPDSQDSHSVRSDMGSRELPIAKNIDQLREMIKREYQALQANAKSYKEVSEAIIRSPGYVEAADLLKNGKSIGETSDIWDELARAVEESYPDFKIKFQTLLGGRMKTREYHMALLIKCGFKPTDLAVLMARSKGTLSNQRNELCRRMTGEDGSAQLADMIISLL